MKKIMLLLYFALCKYISIAQTPITIVNADMPNVNDTIRISTSTSNISFLLNDTGANRTWDASFLVPSFQDMVQCKSVVNTNITYLLSFSSSSFGIQDANLNLGLVAGSEVYNFFSKNATRFANDGRGITFNGIPVPQVYTSKEILYRFPLSYGMVDSSNFVSNEANLLIGSIKTQGTRKNRVDAWGSLTTPYGTFNCIRVKSTVQQVDSIVASGFPFPLASTRTEYKWLAKGQKVPVLQIVTTTSDFGGQVSTTIQYRDVNRPAVFEGNARFTLNKNTFATQNNDTCILTSNSRNNPKAFLWTITPSTYVFTGGTNATSATVKVFFTDTGKYTITLRAIYNAGTDDTTRFDIIRVVKAPNVQFSIAAPSVISTSSVVQLYDSTIGTPAVNSWLWSISPNTVSFVDGALTTSQNPKVKFINPGTYSISLKASNAFASGTATKENIVAVVPTGLDHLLGFQKKVSCYPNPMTDLLAIQSPLAITQLNLFNAIGQKCNVEFIPTNETYQANCSLLKSGVYFLTITLSNGEVYCEKVYKY